MEEEKEGRSVRSYTARTVARRKVTGKEGPAERGRLFSTSGDLYEECQSLRVDSKAGMSERASERKETPLNVDESGEEAVVLRYAIDDGGWSMEYTFQAQWPKRRCLLPSPWSAWRRLP
jgi:hypothetical protein